MDFNGYSQYFENDITFKKNLFEVGKNNNYNLLPITNDETRGKVVKFQKSTNPFFIQPNRDKTISVAFWVKPQNIELHPGTIYGEENNFYLRLLSNHEIQFNHFLRKDTETKAILTENRWQHIGFTINSKGRLKIFFNGQCILRDTIDENWWKKKGKTYIGTDKYNVNAEGFLDHLQTWNRAISEKEMMEVYSSSLKTPPLNYGLKLYLPLKNNLNNKANTKIKLTSKKNISFTKDKEGMKSAKFIRKKSYLKYEGLLFGNQQTISLWIKPSNKERELALIGNSDFSLRYLPKTGRMWYSVPLNYGILAEPAKNIIADNWNHLAISLNYNHLIDFYVNGKKIDSKPIFQNTGKATYLEIGKSFWNNYYDGNIKKIAVWDRKLSDSEIENVFKNDINTPSKQNTLTTEILYLALFLMVLVFVYFKFLRKKEKNQNKAVLTSAKNFAIPLPKLPQKNAIYFLDKFEAYNNNSENLSHEFAPTLIRLFLIILVYPKIFNRNISSNEMSEVLWPNETSSQQKNNRSTNIHRLRSIFKNIEGLSIVYKNKTWQIEISNAIFIDILSIENLFSDWDSENQLYNLKFDKAIYSNNFNLLLRPIQDDIISNLKKTIEISRSNKNWKKVVYLAKLWLSIDSLSTPAIQYIIKTQLSLKQKQKALTAYNSFCENHLELLNKKFDIKFDDFTPYH